jgi:hypothetical protein
MNDDPLERFLEQLRHKPVPGPSDRFDANVWKRIRALRQARAEPWWDALARTFWQPRWVAIALALTLTIGVGAGRLAPAASPPLKGARILEAFSPEAPWLPSTLLSRAR